MKFRLEEDSIGKKEVPVDAYYGVQSLRGKENFVITKQTTHKEMILALAMLKKSCAIANWKASLLDEQVAYAIMETCDEILEGKYHDQFITDPIQGGAGTMTNMNANEVIANVANEKLGGGLGTYEYVHPNDHVNMSQSTNDVFPTAGKIGTLRLLKHTISELVQLKESLMQKAKEFDDVLKMGRTQLQDAVPMRLGQEFHAYASVINRDIVRLTKSMDSIKIINIGATAIGTGLNVDEYYFQHVTEIISKVTGIHLMRADDLIDATNNLDCLLDVSASLKTCAVNLSKIASDLRLMGSGPKTMVSDIILPAKANGSSIMPGKVNPVIPEVVNQMAYRVIGNDMTITMCAEGGQLELNAFEPVLFYALYESIEILGNAVHTFNVNCIQGIEANRKQLAMDVETSVGMITALVPHIGYKKSSDIAKKALKTGMPIRQLLMEENILTPEEIDQILDVRAMTEPGIAAEYLIKEKKKKK